MKLKCLINIFPWFDYIVGLLLHAEFLIIRSAFVAGWVISSAKDDMS